VGGGKPRPDHRHCKTPLRDLRWVEAEKPFLFLAACTELKDALVSGSSCITRLPVSFDGSCSGLQHMCAMVRSPEGALVNLTPNEQMQDVYQAVANRVRGRIEQDLTDKKRSIWRGVVSTGFGSHRSLTGPARP
jgi:DNA-directed RNA polymerase